MDLRLAGPAAAVWAGAALAPGVGARWIVLTTAGAVTAAVALALVGRVRRHALAPTALAALLCAVAGAGVAALHDADTRRGPLPGMARARVAAEVEMRVTGDPFELRPRVRGAARAPRTVVVEGVAERVGDTRIRTPVVVFAEGAVHAWLRLVPSTRVSVSARLAPPAVLRVHGPPRVLAPPSTPQRLAARLRTGLREAASPLSPDARALLPALVVGDTAALTAESKEAFKATGLAHLTAVSGAKFA